MHETENEKRLRLLGKEISTALELAEQLEDKAKYVRSELQKVTQKFIDFKEDYSRG